MKRGILRAGPHFQSARAFPRMVLSFVYSHFALIEIPIIVFSFAEHSLWSSLQSPVVTVSFNKLRGGDYRHPLKLICHSQCERFNIYIYTYRISFLLMIRRW